ARTAPDGGVQRGTASQSEVKDVFGSALAAQPSRPISFILYFESGNDEFTEESKQEVKRLLAEMARRQAPDITVIGHTDQVGTDRIDEGSRIFSVPGVLECLAQPTGTVEFPRRIHCLGRPVGYDTYNSSSAHPMLGGDVGKSFEHA